MKKLLSICIPTYNRFEILMEGLKDLHSKIQNHKDDVQIVVIDNASNDNTCTIQNYFQNVLYIRNEENIGGDLNILKSYKVAAEISEYIIVLGDSYRLSGDIELLLSKLKTHRFDIILINRGLIDNKTSEYNNVDNFIEMFGGELDLVSIMILRKSIVKNEYYEPYLWSNFIHTCMMLNYFSHNKNTKCLYLNEVKITHTVKNKNSTSWYSNYIEIFSKVWMLSILSVPNIKLDSKLICIKNHNNLFKSLNFWGLLLLRKDRFIKYKDFKEYRNYLPFVTDEKLIVIFITTILPPKLCNILIVLKAKIKLKLKI